MKTKILLCVAVLASAAVSARGTNLVVNPGFETGDFTGWTQGGHINNTVVDYDFHSGQYAARLGPLGSNGTLSQTIATVVGQLYTVDFWLMNGGGTPNNFSASFAGVTFYSVVDSPAFPYTQFAADILATSTSSTLLFSYRQDPDYWYLDDVGVNATTSVPDGGATLGLLAVSALGLMWGRRMVKA